MNVLSLFAGIGGLELGLEHAGMHVVGQVEIDPYCRRVLARHWPEVPRHDDVRTCVEWWRSEPRPIVDLICGGFPCQDISNAGRRAGIDGERSGLWTWMRDAIRELRPRYALLENVSAVLVRGLDVVAADLAAIGYDLQWDCIPAAAVGAPHRRDRWFGVAYADGARPQGHWRSFPGARERAAAPSGTAPRTVANATVDGRGQRRPGRLAGDGQNRTAQRPETLADPDGSRRDGRSRVFRPGRRGQPADGGWWAVEPDVGRVAHGIPARVDRLRALGNAVVPQVAEHVGRLIVDYDRAAA